LVPCSGCKDALPFRGLIGQGAPGSTLSASAQWLGSKALHCSGCDEKYNAARLCNSLTLSIRKHVATYYTAALQCEEASCRETSRSLSTHVSRDDAGMPHFPACTVPGCKGRMFKTYTDRRLHTQLLFLKSLFDVEWSEKKMQVEEKRSGLPAHVEKLPPEDEVLFDKLCGDVAAALDKSAYNTVDFGSLFSGVRVG